MMLKRLIARYKHRHFCKLNGYNCPECIYHNFVFDGAVFRGNRCQHPAYLFLKKRTGDAMMDEYIRLFVEWLCEILANNDETQIEINDIIDRIRDGHLKGFIETKQKLRNT